MAVIVYPPDPVGNPNGGQGGDGEIARNVAIQYVAGWDWIQPIRDRNTGIWDKVTVEKTTGIRLKNPHIVTLVPGARFPDDAQTPAVIKVSTEIENPGNTAISGVLQYVLDGAVVKKQVVVKPKTTIEVNLDAYTLKHPKLWWPSGYGQQPLYNIQLQFLNTSKMVLIKKIFASVYGKFKPIGMNIRAAGKYG